MIRFTAAVGSLMLIACGDDGGAGGGPDAGIDAHPDAAPIPGDFSCAGKPLATTAPDPVSVKGLAIDVAESGITGVAIEVHSFANDALLGQATTSSLAGSEGKYAIDVATGGAAPRLYRVLKKAGLVDSYGYDPRPVTMTSPAVATPMLTAQQLDAYYTAAGLVRDPARGTAWIDVHDCGATDNYLAGATVEAPSAGGVFYLDDALAIDKSLTATRSGAVLILNAPAGALDAVIHAGPLTFASWPIAVRAGAFTNSDRLP